MKIKPYLALLLILLCGTAHANESTNYLHQALDAERSGPQFSYDIVYETEDVLISASFDPAQTIGSQLTVHQPPEPEWSTEMRQEIEEFEKDAEEEFWCTSFHHKIPRDAELIAQDHATAIYQFQPIADSDDETDVTFSRNIVGKVVVSKQQPAILKLNLTAPKAFKPVWAVKIHQLDFNVECTKTDDGRTYLKGSQKNITGRAALIRFNDIEIKEISNVQRAK